MRGQIGSYEYMQIMKLFMKVILWQQKCEKAPQETHIHKTAKSKSTKNKIKEEICFILKIYYSSEQKEVDKWSISWQTIGKW